MRRIVPFVVVAALAAVGCKGSKGSADGGESSSGGGGGIFGGLSFLGDKPFEGEIELFIDNVRDKKPGQTIIYQVKQPKMRFDVPPDPSSPSLAKGAWVLVDPPQKKAYMVVDAEKRALVLDLDKVKEQGKTLQGTAGAGGSGAPQKPPPKITKTGKTDKVAGYACEIWLVEEEAKKAEICAAKGITFFDATAMGGGYKEAWMLQMTDANHFPLRIVNSDAQGEASRMEAKRIEKKTLDDARFKVPEGYMVMDLSQLMGGVPMGQPGAPPGMPTGQPLPPGFPSGMMAPPGMGSGRVPGRRAMPQ